MFLQSYVTGSGLGVFHLRTHFGLGFLGHLFILPIRRGHDRT